MLVQCHRSTVRSVSPVASVSQRSIRSISNFNFYELLGVLNYHSHSREVTKLHTLQMGIIGQLTCAGLSAFRNLPAYCAQDACSSFYAGAMQNACGALLRSLLKLQTASRRAGCATSSHIRPSPRNLLQLPLLREFLIQRLQLGDQVLACLHD